MNGKYHVYLSLTDDERWRLKLLAARQKIDVTKLITNLVRKVIENSKEEVIGTTNTTINTE